MSFKLTDQDGCSWGGLRWEVGKVVYPVGVGCKPCGPGVLHAYISGEVAVLANPVHANISNPRLFEIEGDGWETDGLKRWTCGPCRVVRELEVPVLRLEELVAWVICLAPHSSTRSWAVGWLNGSDRSYESARAAVTWAAAAAAAAAARAEAEAAKVAAQPSAQPSASSAAWSVEGLRGGRGETDAHAGTGSDDSEWW